MTSTEPLKVVHPQEIEVWYVLPAIRKELAIAMKQEGLEQNKIAKLLGVTEAAVSQYINHKRGSDIVIEQPLKEEFKKSAKILFEDSNLIFAEVQRLLKIFWDEGIVCKLHTEKCTVPENCGVCF